MFLLASFFIPATYGLLWGALCLVLAVALVFALFKVQRLLELRKWRNRWEPVFIISNHPETDEKTILPEHIDRHTFHVPYKNVMAEKRRIISLLEQSENPFFATQVEDQRLPIVTIFFRHGVNVNEKWQDFDERVTEQVCLVRQAWHEMLDAVNPLWYIKYMHKQ